MKKTKRNYARFFTLLRQVMPELDREEAKSIVATQVSGGRTDSLRDLTDKEWRDAEAMLADRKADSSMPLKRARSQALHQMQLYGIRTTNWEEVNRFTSDARIAGKHFYHLSVPELTALTRKLRAMVAKKKGEPQEEKKEEKKYNMIFIKSKKKVYGN